MRVIYYMSAYGFWRTHVDRCLFPMPFYHPNECEWLVPGTIDQED